ncbi:MAG: PHP domain-containing protein [Candidatus Thorarchaeota archaeon]
MHSHSNFSDGIFSPLELMELAEKEQLTIFSITDHDTLEGTEIANENAKNYSFLYLTGIEISARYEGLKTEILGYNLDVTKAKMGDKLIYVQDAREKRILTILDKLNSIGLELTLEDIEKQIGAGSSPGRPHFARALVEKNYVKSINEAFEIYLAEGRPGYVRRETFEPTEAIELIHSANGVAVLPHPLLIDIADISELETYFDTLLSWDLDGIEIYYNYNHVTPRIPQKRLKKGLEMMKKYSRKNDLLVTGGSDFHGDTGKLGEVFVPTEVTESLLEYFRSKNG